MRISPLDEHNRHLLDQVHPEPYENPVPAERYNLVVIGAGTAGLVTAAAGAGLGGRVALVERHLMGGDCLNVGCVPSKALLGAARAARRIAHAPAFGVRVAGTPEVDFAAVMERMRRLRAQMAKNDSVSRFRSLGVDVFLGEGRFVGGDSIDVAGSRLRFARAVIATGARAALPPIPGLAEAEPLTNESIFGLTQLPRRLAVLGAGPIGCELGQAFRWFGSEVTIVAQEFLPKEDAAPSEIVRHSLERDGIQLKIGANVLSVSRDGATRRLEIECDGQRQTIEADAVLVAAGRAPNVEGLGLESVGVAFDGKGITVDDGLHTTNPSIFAAGDICSPYQFTHAADAMARIVIQNALFFGRKRVSALNIPWCTYTAPEIAHVGMTARAAAAAGIAIDEYSIPFHDVDRAILDGQENGLARAIVRKGTGKLLGVTLVADHAGDMIGEAVLAMNQGVALGSFANTIHPYPTQAEALRKLGDAFNRTRLTPTVKTIFEKLLRWRRGGS